MTYVVTIGAVRPYVVTMPTLEAAMVMINRYLDTPFLITLKRIRT